MADIINLRRARKAKTKVTAEKQAAENRVHFGLGKMQKALAKARQELEARKVDGHKIEAHNKIADTRRDHD